MNRTIDLVVVLSGLRISALPSTGQQTNPDTATCSNPFSPGAGDTLPAVRCHRERQHPLDVDARRARAHPPSITVGEGYGTCNETPAIATTSADGRQRKLKCPTGVELSAMIVKIARTTSDGIWTLTQTITQDKTGNLDGW
jgi:hypothetical protein